MVGVKQTTQNYFIYGELGRFTYQTKRCLKIIKYWVKILHKKKIDLSALQKHTERKKMSMKLINTCMLTGVRY